ncbi:MAG: hypothetical protein KGN78_07045 [Actinomycetales bacterium]|nr:hypothetical protein [Actinomycetales bacterium]
MKNIGPPLLPMLRSRVQGDMLALLFLAPERSFSLTDIARQVGASVRAIHAEANRFVQAGWLLEERVGNNRMLRADTQTIVAGPLTQLLVVTFGPVPLISAALSNLKSIEQAYVYGSWAARHQGIPGTIPNDVDLLVIGDVDIDDVLEAVEDVGTRLRREVNVNRFRSHQWRNPGRNPFLCAVQSRPMVRLNLGIA